MSSFLSTGSLFREVDDLAVESAFNPMAGDMTYLAPAVADPGSFCDPRVIGNPDVGVGAPVAGYDYYGGAAPASSDFDQYLIHLPLAPPSPIPTPPIESGGKRKLAQPHDQHDLLISTADSPPAKRRRPMPQSPPISPDQDAAVSVLDEPDHDHELDHEPSSDEDFEPSETEADLPPPHVSDDTATSPPPPPQTSSTATKTRRGRKPSSDDSNKSFVCDHCNRRFRRQEHLKRHFRSLHTREKPFKCDECGKKFSRSDNLSQHARTHLKQNALASSPPMPTSKRKKD